MTDATMATTVVNPVSLTNIALDGIYGLYRAATPHVGPAWMALGSDSAAQMAVAKTAGMTHTLIQANWDQLQTTAGGAVTVTSVTTAITNALAAGLKVCLEVALQYPPAFALTGAPKFKDHLGVSWDAAAGSGEQIRDWVWSSVGRGYVADYLNKLFVQLPWAKIERVRMGGLATGELQFPGAGQSIRWWGYSAPAQTGTLLAPGMSAAPLAAYVPSSGTAWGDDDENFYAWYRQSLNSWMLFLIAKHRQYFDGPIWVMHPAGGMRPVSQFPTDPDQGANWRSNAAQGVDWDAQIAAYPDANIWPYSTWVDQDHFWGPAWASDVNDGNAAPWYHLLRTAKKYGRAGRIWGENTGGQTNTDMNRVFHQGAVGYGYQGLAWMGHASLITGTDDTYANFTARIAEFT